MITMTAQRLRLILIITFAALVLGVASTVALAAAVGPRISPRSPFLRTCFERWRRASVTGVTHEVIVAWCVPAHLHPSPTLRI